MKTQHIFIYILLLATVLYSCKNDSSKLEPSSTETTLDASENKKQTETIKTRRVQANSVFAKLMVTPETKTFTSSLVTAGITDFLLKGEGPFTIIAPSNMAFEALDKTIRETLLNPKNKENLVVLLKNHIVEGDLSSSDLLQSIKKNGRHTLKTIGGANLLVYLEEGDIMVKDAKGITAKIGKSDILGSNGKVHIIDAVLSATK